MLSHHWKDPPKVGSCTQHTIYNKITYVHEIDTMLYTFQLVVHRPGENTRSIFLYCFIYARQKPPQIDLASTWLMRGHHAYNLTIRIFAFLFNCFEGIMIHLKEHAIKSFPIFCALLPSSLAAETGNMYSFSTVLNPECIEKTTALGKDKSRATR